MRNVLLAGAAALALAGCAQTQWVGPPGSNYTEQSAQCRLYARHGNASSFYVSGNPRFVAGMTFANALADSAGQAQDFDDCMNAAGWTEQAVAAPSVPAYTQQPAPVAIATSGKAYPDPAYRRGDWWIRRTSDACGMAVVPPARNAGLNIQVINGRMVLGLFFADNIQLPETTLAYLDDNGQRFLTTYVSKIATADYRQGLEAAVTEQEVAQFLAHDQIHVDAGAGLSFTVSTRDTQAAYQTFLSVCKPTPSSAQA
jgi:hypothetical protein